MTFADWKLLKQEVDTDHQNKKDRLYHKQKEWHNIWIANNKSKNLLINTLFVLIICFNVGAFIITDVMVTKQQVGNTPEQAVFIESNPTVADGMGYATTRESNIEFNSFMLIIYARIFLLWAFFYYKARIMCRATFNNMLFVLSSLVVATGFDFIHDLTLLLTYLSSGGSIW